MHSREREKGDEDLLIFPRRFGKTLCSAHKKKCTGKHNHYIKHTTTLGRSVGVVTYKATRGGSSQTSVSRRRRRSRRRAYGRYRGVRRPYSKRALLSMCAANVPRRENPRMHVSQRCDWPAWRVRACAISPERSVYAVGAVHGQDAHRSRPEPRLVWSFRRNARRHGRQADDSTST